LAACDETGKDDNGLAYLSFINRGGHEESAVLPSKDLTRTHSKKGLVIKKVEHKKRAAPQQLREPQRKRLKKMVETQTN